MIDLLALPPGDLDLDQQVIAGLLVDDAEDVIATHARLADALRTSNIERATVIGGRK